MSPNQIGSAVVAEAINLDNKFSKQPNATQKHETSEKNQYKWDIVWINVIAFVYLYLGGIYGFYLTFFVASWKTFLWGCYLTFIGGFGTTCGAHRLWTHRTFKAKLPLRILLAYFQTTCFQNHIYEWVRDHRAHHKYTDTDADPHNATRGFFFSHVGWLMVKKHPDVIEKGKTIWLKDLEEDPVVMFQKKYMFILMPLFCFIIPAVVPWYFWGEPFSVAWYSASIFRYTYSLNITWLVNSAAHLYGYRPYDKNINPRENILVGYLSLGEGWHNYHHAFPWDYKTSEIKTLGANLTTGFINLMAKIGWAYDLKTVPEDMVLKRMLRTGDGSVLVNGVKPQIGEDKEYTNHVWGWDDENMTDEDKAITSRYFVDKAD